MPSFLQLQPLSYRDVAETLFMAGTAITPGSATQFSITDGTNTVLVSGRDLAFGDGGRLTGGLIEGYTLYQGPVGPGTAQIIASSNFTLLEIALFNTAFDLARSGALRRAIDLVTDDWAQEYFSHTNYSGGYLKGTAGGDGLFGGGGIDFLFGGAGSDTLVLNTGHDEGHGGEGADFIYGGRGDDLIFGGLGDDVIYADETSGAGGGWDQVYGGAGQDGITGGSGKDSLSGGAGNDTLRGENGDDSLSGGSGGDQLRGDAGQDLLYGGAGTDLLAGNSGDDTLSGGADNDSLYGNSGNDSLLGDGGADRLSGGDGDDRLSGGAGNDSMSGGAGADRLTGGIGTDSLTGGEGADRFVFEALAAIGLGAAADRINDFETGLDRIDLSGLGQTLLFIETAAFSAMGSAELRRDSATGVLQGDVNGDGVAEFSLFLGAAGFGADDVIY